MMVTPMSSGSRHASVPVRFPLLRAYVSRGFSLVELMIVLAVTTILVAMTTPAFNLLTSSGFTSCADQIEATLQAARNAALAQNTYAWVGFNVQSQGNGSQVVVAAVYSLSGENDTSAANLRPLLRPFTRTNVQLNAAPATQTGVDNLQGSTFTFQQTVGGESAPRTFSDVIQFSPIGEASIKSNSSKLIQFQIQPLRGSVADPKNVALIEICGMSGLAQVLR